MKIALCYSGDLRTYRYCSENHYEIFKNADVYFSVWDTFGNTKKINDPWHILMPNDLVTEVTEDYIKKYTNKNLNIIKINIENKTSYKSNLIENDNFFNLRCQYYKIKKCFDLIEGDYDFIVRIRPDITIKKIKYDDNKIIHNQYIWYDYFFTNDNLINEMIWICNKELMKRSVNIYENFDKIKSLDKIDCGEKFCFKNLEIENLINYLDFLDFGYNVVRS